MSLQGHMLKLVIHKKGLSNCTGMGPQQPSKYGYAPAYIRPTSYMLLAGGGPPPKELPQLVWNIIEVYGRDTPVFCGIEGGFASETPQPGCSSSSQTTTETLDDIGTMASNDTGDDQAVDQDANLPFTTYDVVVQESGFIAIDPGRSRHTFSR